MTNSPTASRLSNVSFLEPSRRRVGEKTTTGGLAPKALKKLNGARLTRPSASTVVTQAIGRGRHDADQGPVDRDDVRGGDIDDHLNRSSSGDTTGRPAPWPGGSAASGRTVSTITASSSVERTSRLATIVPGCGPCGMPRGWSVNDDLLDAAPAAELAAHVVQHLVGLHVRVGVRAP